MRLEAMRELTIGAIMRFVNYQRDSVYNHLHQIETLLTYKSWSDLTFIKDQAVLPDELSEFRAWEKLKGQE